MKNNKKHKYLADSQIIENLPVGIFIYKLVKPNKLILVAGNAKAENLTGIKAERFAGKEFCEIWSKKNIQQIKQRFLRVLRNRKTFITDQIDYRSGKIKGPLRVKVFALKNDLLGVVFDNISKLKSAEIKIKRIHEKLEIQTWGLEKANEGIKTLYKELENKNKELQKSYRKLKNLSLKDPHTGFYNHRYLEEVIDAEFFRAIRNKASLSLVMIDIDYFKSVNDVYGHKFGDFVLKQFAKQLKKMIRRYDIVIRFGGEEFVIISPGIDRTQALIQAQRILDQINLYHFGKRNNRIKLTMSMSVVAVPQDKISKASGLVQLADKVLDAVKKRGGNRVYCSLDIEQKEDIDIVKQNGKTESIKMLKNQIEKLNKRTNQSVVESIFAFAKTIELKDHYTGEHVEMSVHYATEIARAIGLSEDEVVLVRQAAILHDLGKIGISDKILKKPGKLNKKEFLKIRQHPKIGADIIRPINLLHEIVPLILYHHEKWDGTGYPYGMKGEDIPIGARIIALADVFQALTSERPYRKAFPKDKAIKIVRQESGKQFDPRVVKVFLKVIKKNVVNS